MFKLVNPKSVFFLQVSSQSCADLLSGLRRTGPEKAINYTICPPHSPPSNHTQDPGCNYIPRLRTQTCSPRPGVYCDDKVLVNFPALQKNCRRVCVFGGEEGVGGSLLHQVPAEPICHKKCRGGRQVISRC